ncbi:FtsQ-type POTRA domain-containing protein [Candidatus Woesebacteria bacterium]|nr:FtsQ-type POTRA domain-containing protein [Candidatus Woesebacteria bacterium]
MDSPHVFHPAKSKYLVITMDYLLPLFLSALVVFLFYLAIFSPIFRVNQVTCTLDYSDCRDPSVLAELDKLKGQNIFRLQPDSLRSKLTSGDFTIREVSMKKSLPGKVEIELESVYPVVALQVTGDPNWVVLDHQYRVIATRNADPNVPTVIVPNPLVLTVGKPVTDDVLVQSIKLALSLSSELISVKSITMIDENTIHITLASGIIAVFSPRTDEARQLKSLQAVLSGGTITKGIRTIDVRFTQPVLR